MSICNFHCILQLRLGYVYTSGAVLIAFNFLHNSSQRPAQSDQPRLQLYLNATLKQIQSLKHQQQRLCKDIQSSFAHRRVTEPKMERMDGAA